MCNLKKEDQLCWDCVLATGGCSWSAEGKPVEGWRATPTKIENDDEIIIHSYKITACPMFQQEEKRRPEIFPGDRIKLDVLGEVLGVCPRTLKTWQDKRIIDCAAKKGLNLEVQRKNIRIIKFVGFVKKKSRV